MTQTTVDLAPDGTPEGDDLLAAEYVLGTLPLTDRMAFEARLRTDAGLARRLDRWEAHFAPLNEDYATVPAANLLPQIEARLFPRPARRRLPFWSGLLGGLVTVGLIVVALSQLLPGPAPETPDLVATLAGAGQPLVYAASYDTETDVLTVKRTAGEPAGPGHDHELWVIGTAGVPVSLGVIAGDTATVTLPDLLPDFVLAVSLEATGGSTTGAPAAVLVTGVVAAL